MPRPHVRARAARTLLVLALSALLALGLAACSPPDEPVEPAPEPTATPEPEPEPSEPAEEISLNVYLVRGEHLGVGVRDVEHTVATAEAALEKLLGGATDEEAEAGLATEIPGATELLGVDVDDGVATVDLSAAFESGGGSLSMQLRVAQVVFTLTQFDTVDRVAFMIEGEPVDAIGGEGIVVAPPVGRLDLADNTAPAILVESPAPWQDIASPLRVTGMSNTFEGTVVYEVVDPSGRIVDEGFTTATAGNGVWGTFDFTTEFGIERDGVGALIVFEQSAKDGSRINLVEIPLRMAE